LTIGFSFELTNGDTIYVCGYKQSKALDHALFYIEFDVPRFESEMTRKAFISGSSSDRQPILWPKREGIGDDTECVRLYQIPQGHHVLTVSTGVTPVGVRQLFTSAVTHLISF